MQNTIYTFLFFFPGREEVDLHERLASCARREESRAQMPGKILNSVAAQHKDDIRRGGNSTPEKEQHTQRALCGLQRPRDEVLGEYNNSKGCDEKSYFLVVQQNTGERGKDIGYPLSKKVILWLQ